MDARDPIIHEQMKHIVDFGRRAVVADRAVFLVQMYDDEKKATATMATFSVMDAESKHVIVPALLMLQSGMNALLSSESIRPGTRVEIKIVSEDGSEFSLKDPDSDVEFTSIKI